MDGHQSSKQNHYQRSEHRDNYRPNKKNNGQNVKHKNYTHQKFSNSNIANSAQDYMPHSSQDAVSSAGSSSNYQQGAPQNSHYHKNRKYSNTTWGRDEHDQKLPDSFNENYSSRSKREIPPRFLQASSESTETYSAIGSVVNGRYVPKNSSGQAESKLNVDAAVFVPKINNESNNRSEGHYYNGTRQKRIEKRNSNERYNKGKSFKSYSEHDQNKAAYHNRDSQGGFTRQKFSRSSSRKNSLVDEDIASGIDLRAEESFYEDWEVEDDSMASTQDVKISGNIKMKAFNLSKNKESTTQRERLVSQLLKGDCECLVCCEFIRNRDYIWSCTNCYHVFHLRCIKKWARSPAAVVKDCGWRCPACQNVNEKPPMNYYCFCGKCKDPEVNFHLTPHSCGEVCGRKREDERCIHRCNILCHPGACPPCTATMNRKCECGKTDRTVPCTRIEPIVCSSSCDKLLNCGVHRCQVPCHTGNCEPCSVMLKQKCYCKKDKREVLCSAHTARVSGYSCNNPCNERLTCNNHFCSTICHEGPCATCKLLPDAIASCPCGKTPLLQLYSEGKYAVRLSCVDPIPLCDNTCEKALLCGPKDNHHKCKSSCHLDECEPCDLTTMVKCRCGSTTKEISCKDMLKMNGVFQCEKRCNRRKDCGRHKCLNHCCVNLVHRCELVCNKKLSCGSHQCQETCHGGKCPTCWNVSFDELRCHCNTSVLYPPIHCGTKPPECQQPCIRSHPCNHKVQHTCHSEDKCPPCTVLTVKWCFGQHEKRSSVQCFLDGISCGKPCGKALSCGRHKCLEACHTGNCLKSDKCSQPCTELRTCGHACALPCHEVPCPESVCKAKVEVSCPCGLRSEITTCSEDTSAYRLMSVSILASKIQDIKAGESVNISDIFNKKGKTSRLQCNEDCAVRERNKRLALALQIQNPELSCKPGPPNYSEFLKEEARKNLKFVSGVYDKCSELVQLAKQSKQKSRSYAFPSMNRNHRRVVHELAEFFGCETQSYDEEPVKNVVITAFREKSWLPFVSIVTVAERDMGLRRGPAPVTSHADSKVFTQLSLAEKKEKVIDYFDYTDS